MDPAPRSARIPTRPATDALLLPGSPLPMNSIRRTRLEFSRLPPVAGFPLACLGNERFLGVTLTLLWRSPHRQRINTYLPAHFFIWRGGPFDQEGTGHHQENHRPHAKMVHTLPAP